MLFDGCDGNVVRCSDGRPLTQDVATMELGNVFRMMSCDAWTFNGKLNNDAIVLPYPQEHANVELGDSFVNIH